MQIDVLEGLFLCCINYRTGFFFLYRSLRLGIALWHFVLRIIYLSIMEAGSASEWKLGRAE